jgi:hypothetical protein
MQAGRPARTLGCLFQDLELPEPHPGQETYDTRHDPFSVAEEMMEAHGLVSRGDVDDYTLAGMLMSACCDGFFEDVRDPIEASVHRTFGHQMAEDLVNLVEAAKHVARWHERWTAGAFLELALLDLFGVDGVRVVLPAIERMVQGYRESPFDIHADDVLDQMVLPFVQFFESLRPGPDNAALRAFVMDGLRGRWPVKEEEVFAAIDRVHQEGRLGQ